MRTNTATSIVAFLTLSLIAATSADTPQIQPDSKLVTIANLDVRIGVDLARGGAIAWLSDVQRAADRNLVNVHDTGRYIQQSYYAGPQPFGEPHPGWKNWPWNPIGAGDVYGNRAAVLDHRVDEAGGTIYVKTRPMQWALNNVPGDCVFETWITLAGPAARVRCRLTNQRTDHTDYPARHQELPAVYPIAALGRLMTYTGDKPFTGAPLTHIERVGQPWNSFHATEHWAACVDDTGRGVGVYHAGVTSFKGGYHLEAGKGGSLDDATGYITPIRTVALKHDAVFEYEYDLIVGSLPTIRDHVYRHRPQPDAAPDPHRPITAPPR